MLYLLNAGNEHRNEPGNGGAEGYTRPGQYLFWVFDEKSMRMFVLPSVVA